MPGKMARSDPRPSVRVTRGAGSGQHLASVLQEGRENANIDAGLGFIWRISVHFSGRPSETLDHPQEPATLFLSLQSASHLRPCDACGHARAGPGRALDKEGIMHATLSPSWKKSLLLVFVSVVAFATATPATSGPQCFFQGLGFVPGGGSSVANGVNADGTVVVGQASDASGQPQAFRWTRATRMQSVLTLLLAAKVVTMTGWQLRSANGVSADGTVIVGDGVDPLGQNQGWIARLPKESNEDCEGDDDNQGDNDNQGKDFGQ